MRSIGRIAAVLALVGAAACGSTLPETPQQATTGVGTSGPIGAVPTGEDGFDAPAAGSAGTTGTDTASAVSAGDPAGGSTAPGRVGAGPSPGSPASDSASQSSSTPTPVSSGEPLKVGVFTLEFGALPPGFEAAALGDPENQARILTKWVNDNGGLAGRPVELVYAATDPTQSTPAEQQEQEACVKLTEDNQVFAAVTATTATFTFHECMAQAKTPLFQASTFGVSQEHYDKNPDLFFSTTPSTDRVSVTLADGLHRMGYFEPGSKFGIVYTDSGYYIDGANRFKEAVAQHGLRPTAEAAFCLACSDQDRTNQAQNAILKFQTEGVTHVVFLDNVATSSFQQAADAQAYYPRLGLSSYLVLDLMSTLRTPQALEDALAVGFAPTTDVNAAHDGEENMTPARLLCEQLMRDGGEEFSNRFALTAAMYNCDSWFLLKAAVDAAGVADVGALQTGVHALGESFQTAVSWHTYFAPGRHDGIQTWRPLAYDSGCRCFAYTSPEFVPFSPLPGQAR